MDERNNHFDFDFTPIGQAIKKAREAKGMTREQLSGISSGAVRQSFLLPPQACRSVRNIRRWKE